jgi:RNA polymerase sigma-70 factor (ECF subfamily)
MLAEDWRLIRRFNKGDRDAFRRIYEKYRIHMLRVAGVLLYDTSGVEDVVHDVMVSFASQAGRFRLTGSLKGYLAVCVANRARDVNRMEFRKEHRRVELDREPSTATDPASSLQIQEALAQLPFEQGEVVVLHLQQGLRFREIARQKQTSINTVTSRYRYGLQRLRSLLEVQS